MSQTIPLLIPRENANDDLVTVVRWLVPDGQPVEPGQELVELENSKSVFTLTAEKQGVLHCQGQPGQAIEVGQPIGYLQSVNGHDDPRRRPEGPLPRSDSAQASDPATAFESKWVPGTSNAEHIATNGPSSETRRLSRRASQLAQQLQLDLGQLPAGRRLVREADLRRLINDDRQPPPHRVAAPSTNTGDRPLESADANGADSTIPAHWTPLAQAKQVESRRLRRGMQQTLPSLVTLLCPTRGLRDLVARGIPAAPSVTAICLFETARLLRKYPEFNAVAHGDQVQWYDTVDIAVAMDDGRGLKAPVIRRADTLSLSDVSDELERLGRQYLDNCLRPADLADPTFTITDLSAAGVFAFGPLITGGQSAILGIGGECQIAAGASAFTLNLTFDHQLATGRSAAAMLHDLRQRLAAYETACGDSQQRCDRCGQNLQALQRLGGHLLQCAGPYGYLCSLCLLGD